MLCMCNTCLERCVWSAFVLKPVVAVGAPAALGGCFMELEPSCLIRGLVPLQWGCVRPCVTLCLEQHWRLVFSMEALCYVHWLCCPLL